MPSGASPPRWPKPDAKIWALGDGPNDLSMLLAATKGALIFNPSLQVTGSTANKTLTLFDKTSWAVRMGRSYIYFSWREEDLTNINNEMDLSNG
jgi:hypothetical protein